jgi:mRNA-degrading endonuclease toxin of MazEF toxin-antitoxin module
LVEQLAAIDARRVGETVGRLAVEEMWSVDDALALVAGLH